MTLNHQLAFEEKINSAYEVKLNHGNAEHSHKVVHWFTSAAGQLSAETVALANSQSEAEIKRAEIIKKRLA